MLLAACNKAGVTALYSEDVAAGMNYDGVTGPCRPVIAPRPAILLRRYNVV
jgi:hypothetical protein